MTSQHLAEQIVKAEQAADRAGKELQAHFRQYGIGGSPILQEVLGSKYQSSLRVLRSYRRLAAR